MDRRGVSGRKPVYLEDQPKPVRSLAKRHERLGSAHYQYAQPANAKLSQAQPYIS